VIDPPHARTFKGKIDCALCAVGIASCTVKTTSSPGAYERLYSGKTAHRNASSTKTSNKKQQQGKQINKSSHMRSDIQGSLLSHNSSFGKHYLYRSITANGSGITGYHQSTHTYTHIHTLAYQRRLKNHQTIFELEKLTIVALFSFANVYCKAVC
jgi:hypothetical protein